MAIRYERIADEIRQQIVNGSLPAGSRLPAESALAPQYRVSVPTIRQALDVLQSEGLIEKRHGSGNFIRKPQPKIDYTGGRFWLGWNPNQVFRTDARSTAADLIEVTADFREVKACDDLGSRMGVRPGTRLVECEYRSWRLPTGSPFVVVRSYLLRSVVGEVPPKLDVGGTPWGDEYRKLLAAAGIELNYVIERLSARPPSVEEAELLGVSRGVAILALERTAYGTDGQVVEVADIIMSGDRVEAVYTNSSHTNWAPPTVIGGYGDNRTESTDGRSSAH